MADLRFLWGVVDPDGNPISGSGYRCQRIDEGLYLIVFDESYSGSPAVIGTQIFPNELSSFGGNTRDNLVVVGVEVDRCKIKVGDAEGKSRNRWFSFLVAGI